MNTEPKPFRILITSLSAKVPLVTAFRTMFKDIDVPFIVYGGDCNPHCIGRYFVDNFWHMPPINKLAVAEIIDYCQKQQIEAIIPTRDGELPFFSQFRSDIEAAGIFVLSSPADGVQTCLDKLAFYQACPNVSIQTETVVDQVVSSLYVAKERYGAGSRDILLKASKKEAQGHAEKLQNPIFQPWIEGQEYTIDLYLTRTGQELGAIVRSRDLVVAGEAQITSTVSIPALEETCVQLAKQLQLSGHVVFQALIDNQCRTHIIECNCRIGGASTLSFAAGLNSPLWLFCETRGIAPSEYPFNRSSVEVRQIRHAADTLIQMEN